MKQYQSLISSVPSFCISSSCFKDNTINKNIKSHSDLNMSSSSILPFDFNLILNKKNSFKSNFYLLQSSTGNNSNSSSTTGGDGTSTANTGSIRSGVPHGSHIVTRHAPYQMPYHHRGNRSHRGGGHPRGEQLPKKTTGIPRDRLIPVPKHIPGALRDQTGASVVPRQMA